MSLFQAAIYGLVQGLGEFLPISSSAHLILVPWFFGWNDPGLTFDVALHVGTLVAVVAYFWRDWWVLIVKGFTDRQSRAGRLFWYLVLATIPGALGGFLLEKKAETVFRDPILISAMLVVMAVCLFVSDRSGAKKKDMGKLTLATSLGIGLSQVLAIIPGVSRSGVTMTAGLFSGLTREDAARFSFLLSTPIILGAALVKVPHLIRHPSDITAPFLLGVTVSCLVGLLSIGFLLRYVRTRSFLPFVIYRFVLAGVVLVVSLTR